MKLAVVAVAAQDAPGSAVGELRDVPRRHVRQADAQPGAEFGEGPEHVAEFRGQRLLSGDGVQFGQLCRGEGERSGGDVLAEVVQG